MSLYGSTALWTLADFQFLNLYTVGRNKDVINSHNEDTFCSK
jgi:hypothetical protein